MSKKFICLAIVCTLLTGCTHAQRRPAAILNEGGGRVEDPEIDKNIVDADKVFSEEITQVPTDPINIPIEINNRVAAWIHHFTVKDKARTIRYFSRGSAYRKQLDKIFAEHDVPKELFYLAMIESGFVNTARSRAQAVGIWQFIRGTGRNYGLKINKYVDERQNWIKATEAAVTYLKDLRNVFGSWYLAFAAYNAGEYRIVRSIMKGKSRDFWALAEGKILPRETLNYVPKFLAAIIISRNLEKYGITFDKAEEWPEFEAVRVPSGLGMKSLASAIGIPSKELKKWNPDVLRGVIPYTRSGSFEIYIPKHRLSRFLARKGRLAKLRKYRANKGWRKSRKKDFSIYVVRRGDTLTRISRLLGVSIRTLKRLNRIRRSSRIHPGQRIRYYTNLTALDSRRAYLVRKNDTLYSVAKKHKTTIKELKRRNKLKSEKIFVGQRLRVPASIRVRGVFHSIKKGENLSLVARKYDTTVATLRKLNKLRSAKVFPGQRILVRSK